MFCPNCGAKIPDDINFWGQCGYSLNKQNNENNKKKSSSDDLFFTAEDPSQIEEIPRKAHNNKKTGKSDKGRKIALITFAVIIVCGAALALLLVFAPNNSNDTNNSIAEATARQTEAKEQTPVPQTPKPTPSSTVRPTPSPTENATEKPSEPVFVAVNNGVNEIDERYVDSDGYMPEENVDEAIQEVLEYAENQMRNGRVTYFEEGTNAVYMELSDNTGYVYIAKTLGTKTGEGELKIVTMEPSKKTVPLKYQEFEEYMDDSAVLISEFSEYYSFDTDNDNYNDSEIAIETLKEFAEYSIIIWSGHGIYFEETGPLMCTELNAKVAKKGYEDDFSNNRLYSTNKNKVLISKDFFDHYFDDNDLEGSLIYLATCLSGADNQLARVLQDKGAEVVIGSSGIISFEYCDKMLKTFFESLCEYETTIEEALVSAQNEHGSFDPDNPDTQVVMFGNTKFALEYPKTNLDGKSLTGYFTYKGSTDLHQFLIDFKQKDDVISGTIYDEYGEASFIGYIDGTYFQFVKTYKQAAGAEQPPRPEVLYQGEIFPGRHIDGEWQMLGEDYSGYFSIFLE